MYKGSEIRFDIDFCSWKCRLWCTPKIDLGDDFDKINFSQVLQNSYLFLFSLSLSVVEPLFNPNNHSFSWTLICSTIQYALEYPLWFLLWLEKDTAVPMSHITPSSSMWILLISMGISCSTRCLHLEKCFPFHSVLSVTMQLALVTRGLVE